MLALTEADAGKTVDVTAGDIVEIRLPESTTTGYQWKLEAITTPVCEMMTEERQAPNKIIPGAPGAHVWRLKIARAGECKIEIGYRRVWEIDVPPTRTFKLELQAHV